MARLCASRSSAVIRPGSEVPLLEPLVGRCRRQPISVFTYRRQDRVEQERSWTGPGAASAARPNPGRFAIRRAWSAICKAFGAERDTFRAQTAAPWTIRSSSPREYRRRNDDVAGAGQLRRMSAAETADVWRCGGAANAGHASLPGRAGQREAPVP